MGKFPDLTGSIVYDEFNIVKHEENQRLYLDDTHSFSGDTICEGLANCDRAVVSISTVDPIFEKTYRQMADTGGVHI